MAPEVGPRPIERVTVVGTGLIGTSIAMAAARAACEVRVWDADPEVASRAAARTRSTAAVSLEDAVEDAQLVIVCTPIDSLAGAVVASLRSAPGALVIDTGSVKTRIVDEVAASADARDLDRFVGSHPMGGTERSGPDHASPSVVDGIVWALTPTGTTDPAAVA